MASLTQLPGELVDQVCSYLPKDDLHNFRLTCKELIQKSERQFAIYHFQVTRVIVTREGLETLISIAKDVRYGPRIKEVELCLITFLEVIRACIHGKPMTEHARDLGSAGCTPIDLLSASHGQQKQSSEDCTRAREKSLRRQRRRHFGHHQISQSTMRKQAIDVELLAEALRNLPGLQSLTIVSDIDESQPPWGARKLRSELGMWPPTASINGRERSYIHKSHFNVLLEELFRTYVQCSSHAFTLVLGALIRSGTKLKRSFAIDTALYAYNFPRSQSSRALQPGLTPAKTFSEEKMVQLKPCFTDLKELSLSVKKWGEIIISDELTSMSWISRFIPLWPAVEKLTIVGTFPARPLHRRVATSLSKEKSIQLLALSKDTLPRLRHLCVRNLEFSMKDLLKFVTRHFETMETLELIGCQMYSLADSTIFKALVGAPAMISVVITAPVAHHNFLQFHFPPYPTISSNESTDIIGFQISRKTPAEFQDALNGTPVLSEKHDCRYGKILVL